MKHQLITLHDGFRMGAIVGGDPMNQSIVFFHGLTASAGTYLEMLEMLVDVGFHVIAIDAPNHGRSDLLPWDSRIEDHAERLVEALEMQPGFTPTSSPSWVVGHSMGGALAIEVANLRPWHTKGLILMDAAVGESHHRSIRIDHNMKTPLAAVRFAAGSLMDIVGDAALAMSVRPLRDRLSLVKRLRSTTKRGSFFRSAWALMHHDSAPALSGIREHGIVTHHLHGTRDHMIRPLAAADAVTLSGGKLHLVDGAFHSWMVAAPALGRAWIRTLTYDYD